MRRLVLALVVVACCFAMSGCFTFDSEHNRMHWKVIKRDVMLLHEDLDFILAMDEESPLESYYR
jgi:hypothetical protein